MHPLKPANFFSIRWLSHVLGSVPQIDVDRGYHLAGQRLKSNQVFRLSNRAPSRLFLDLSRGRLCGRFPFLNKSAQ